jgi:hypothetical protein
VCGGGAIYRLRAIGGHLGRKGISEMGYTLWAEAGLFATDGFCFDESAFSEFFIYFLFQFTNLYNRFEIYQNYISTAMAYGG